MSVESSTLESEIAASSGSPVKKVVKPETDVKQPASNGDGKENGKTESPTKKDEGDEIASAKMHLAAGKRALLVQDPNGAVTSLETASEKFGKIYGETGKECGEPYFYYGKALLELARVEAGVIDNGLEGVPDTEDEEDNSLIEGPKPTEEEAEKIAEEVEQALEENFKELEKKANGDKNGTTNGHANGDKNGTTNGDDTKMETDENDGAKMSCIDNNGVNGKAKKDSEENSAEEEDEDEEEDEAEEEEKEGGVEGEAGPSTSKDVEGDSSPKDNESVGSTEAGPSSSKEITDQNAQAQEEEEDPSNLQLAWEMLELAKSIFSKHADSLEAADPVRLELESKLSETYQTLGEVSIENENYPQAIEDLTMCLRRRQDLLPEDNRSVAETHYQLGVALGFNTQFDEAVNALNDAISVLEKRVTNLKEKKESRGNVTMCSVCTIKRSPSLRPAHLDLSTKDAPAIDDDTRKKEIAELEGLIPEIREKIADTKDMQQETLKKIGDRRLIEDAFNGSASKDQNGSANKDKNGDSSTSEISVKKSAGNISHLVKKRSNDEKPAAGDASPKKPRLETNGSSSNGASSSNGH